MMEIVFWAIIILLSYTYGGYTLAILFVSLLYNRPVERDDGYEPFVTFLITAYNEERDLARKLDNTLGLDYPEDKLEILVASDGSTDGTDDIVKSYAEKDRRVRLLRVEGRVGKTATQNQAVAAARGEVIVFSDATTEYREDAVRKLVRNYADPAVGAVSGKYAYRTEEGSSMGLSTILFWTYENFIKSRQTRVRTITGCCGCIYSVRKSAYVPLPRTIISDLVEPLKIIEGGHRVVFESEAIAFETTTEKVREEFGMRVRVITRGMNGILYVSHLLNPFKYPFVSFQLLSHKVLRWLVPLQLLVLLGASIVLAGQAWYYALALALQLLFYGLALLGLLLEQFGRRSRLTAIPLYFCVVNIASLAGMVNLLRGERKVVWETTRN
jgi:cellulose synthase/poly-beta-1,6-N-acetylglucosamine synthase-like glycosyltransferase